MKTHDFDSAFDSGKDITKQLNTKEARRVNQEQRRVNVDFPIWMIELLDKEAHRVGVTRQAIIKMWLAERLENE